jgi:hypothetical protein
MKKVLLTAGGTICVFAAGVFAGMWIQRTQPVPPPPIGMLGEIRDVPISPASQPPSAAAPSKNRKDMPQLKAEIDRLKPDIEAFKKKLDPLKQEFRTKLEAQLTPEQQEKLKALSERFSGGGGKDESKENPGKRPSPHRDGLDSLFPIVLVPTTLERLTAELQLTEAQRPVIHELLLERRQKFLQLVDANPPPSLQLGKIAPLVPQVAKPESK